MARISNRNCITSTDISVDSDIGIPKLDIYIGYTEELLKLCARIAELPFLQADSLALRLSVASMLVSLFRYNKMVQLKICTNTTSQKRIPPHLVSHFNPQHSSPRDIASNPNSASTRS